MFRDNRLNLLLFFIVLVLAQGALFSGSRAQAATTPFLYRPYYGSFVGWNAHFDHQSPNYASDGTFVRYNGVSATPPVCSDYCYDGHSGIDYRISYLPIVASASGVVEYAGWASTNHEYSYGLMIKMTHNNNHQTIYGHMSMVRYSTGASIGRYQIGTGGTTGNSTGPHLHFEVRTLHNGSWKVKDPHGWTGTTTDPWKAAGGPESEWLWVSDPTQPPPTYSDTSVADNSSSFFSRGCGSGTSCPYWYSISGMGYNNSLFYTYSSTSPSYWAKWNTPYLPSTGQYEVEAYIPSWDGTRLTHAARYEIYHASGMQVVVVDQHDISYPGQWISLGRYNFTKGSGPYEGPEATTAAEYVRVTDSAYIDTYRESGKMIFVDAVRWRKTH